MVLQRLWLRDFRNYAAAEVSFSPGVTVVVGGNGEGKTNLLEAVGFLGALSSFRGATVDALVRHGRTSAIIRGEADQSGRSALIEIELNARGRTRAQLNRQRVARAGELREVLPATVFAPDDLNLVKGSPHLRRDYLDRGLAVLDPRQEHLRRDVDKILKQRNALLRQARGRYDRQVGATLDVWDARLAPAGDALGRARQRLVEVLEPEIAAAYSGIAESNSAVVLRYTPDWLEAGLEHALRSRRDEELRRGVSLVGPHRDELEIGLAGMPARTRASQGEQRSLALALRLGHHAAVTRARRASPLLLLDDVFSELDPQRSAALLRNLPGGQTIMTTAGVLPEGVAAESVLAIADGTVRPAARD